MKTYKPTYLLRGNLSCNLRTTSFCLGNVKSIELTGKFRTQIKLLFIYYYYY